MFELRCHGWFAQHGEVALLSFGRRDVADGPQQPAIAEPVVPGQCHKLDGLEASPGPTPMNELCLVEAVDRFSESIRQRARCQPQQRARCIDAGDGTVRNFVCERAVEPD